MTTTININTTITLSTTININTITSIWLFGSGFYSQVNYTSLRSRYWVSMSGVAISFKDGYRLD